MRTLVYGILLGAMVMPVVAQEGIGPVNLRVNGLEEPLGMDSAPRFSWQLSDTVQGTKQTAYEVMVATSAALLDKEKPDVWDSGRVATGQSLNVKYAGTELKPSTRYFWTVKVWGVAGKVYPHRNTWWETGLLKQDNWRAEWISYETPLEAALRGTKAEWVTSPDTKELNAEHKTELRIAYRTEIDIAAKTSVDTAVLYVTGLDTTSVWVNGVKVKTAEALPPWKQMPWRKYEPVDVRGQLVDGRNSIAIEVLRHVENPKDLSADDATPMNATLVVGDTSGGWKSYGSGANWKTAIHAQDGWEKREYDAAGWKQALLWSQRPGSESLGVPWPTESVKDLRKEFRVVSRVKSARLYATALGWYQMYINGKQVSHDYFAPGWTDYRQWVKYQTYDVTDRVVKGGNVIAAELAPGWYGSPLEWFQQPNNYGLNPPALRAQLRIEYTDGKVEWVTTGPGWHGGLSFIQHAELYDGETQDGRLMSYGWIHAGFDDSKWAKAKAIQPEQAMRVEAQEFPSVRMDRVLEPKSVSQPKPGIWVYDFGQNFTGVEMLLVSGPAGTDVKVRFAEVLNEDGTLYTDNLRTAKVTDHFILAGKNTEVFIPQFTFHGFRYLEISGLPGDPGKDAVSGIVIHTDAPFTAELSTGSTMINQLWSNILWGQRSNFVGIPTDCPQRDERLGWMADAQVFWRTASYNMGLESFSRKYAEDMRGTQSGTPYYGIYAPGVTEKSSSSGAGWSDAGVVIPWTSWLQTGDTGIVDENWDAMQKYLDAIEEKNPDGLWKVESGIAFGDWLSPEGKTDQVLIATAYWAYDVTLMKQMAIATGRTADADRYAKLFEKIRTAFIHKFVRQDGFVTAKSDENSGSGDTQTGYVLALHMNLVTEELRSAVVKKLANKIEANKGLIGTGFLGTPYLLEELTKGGEQKLAYKLLLNTEYPSWGYLVEHGATTMWERWNGDQMRNDPTMNSYNHYAYGAVADWMYRYAAGVDAMPEDAGFHTVLLHPVLDARLGKLSFDYQSSYGKIHSDWEISGSTAKWNLNLPPNTTGWLPLNGAEVNRYTLDGVPLTQNTYIHSATRNGVSGYVLEPGRYSFTVAVE